jgi:hypothetical protein
MNKLTVGLTLFLLVVITGCRPAETTFGDQAADDSTIVCEVFYRQGGEQAFEEAPLITFAGGNDKQSRAFENMVLDAWFQDDEYEGRALTIEVATLDTNRGLAWQLYQFDPQNPVENQFIGEHGFTGLNYVFHPTSAAEVQYYCSVRND